MGSGISPQLGPYTEGTIDEAFLPKNLSFQLFNSFLQDELTLKPNRLFLTVGVKLEHKQ